MTFFGKKLIFKYKKEESKDKKIYEEPEDADVIGGDTIKVKPSKVKMTLVRASNKIPLGSIPVYVGVDIKTKAKDDMGIILRRNNIFDMFRITLEQSKKQVIFEKIDPK